MRPFLPYQQTSGPFRGECRRDGGEKPCDLYLKFLRTSHDVFPRERARKLSGKLVVERNGIVIVDEHEMRAHGEIGPALKNEAVFYAAGNLAHIEVREIKAIGCLAHQGEVGVSVASAPSVRSIVKGPAAARTA